MWKYERGLIVARFSAPRRARHLPTAQVGLAEHSVMGGHVRRESTIPKRTDRRISRPGRRAASATNRDDLARGQAFAGYPGRAMRQAGVWPGPGVCCSRRAMWGLCHQVARCWLAGARQRGEPFRGLTAEAGSAGSARIAAFREILTPGHVTQLEPAAERRGTGAAVLARAGRAGRLAGRGALAGTTSTREALTAPGAASPVVPALLARERLAAAPVRFPLPLSGVSPGVGCRRASLPASRPDRDRLRSCGAGGARGGCA